MSNRLAKKSRAQVSINAMDAQEIALIMRLHFQTCLEHASNAHAASTMARDEAEKARLWNVEKSWDRRARKARSYADQFEAISSELTQYRHSVVTIR
jgi:hypothetical protein